MAAREWKGEQEKGKPKGGQNRHTFGDKPQAVLFHGVSISHRDDATANAHFDAHTDGSRRTSPDNEDGKIARMLPETNAC